MVPQNRTTKSQTFKNEVHRSENNRLSYLADVTYNINTEVHLPQPPPKPPIVLVIPYQFVLSEFEPMDSPRSDQASQSSHRLLEGPFRQRGLVLQGRHAVCRSESTRGRGPDLFIHRFCAHEGLLQWSTERLTGLD